MMSQRGVLNIFHSDAERGFAVRRGNSMRLQGVDAVLLDRDGVRAMLPMVAMDNPISPFSAGCFSRAAARRGTMR